MNYLGIEKAHRPPNWQFRKHLTVSPEASFSEALWRIEVLWEAFEYGKVNDILDLSDLKLRKLPVVLGKLTWLRELWIEDNELTDEDVSILSTLKELKRLSLARNSIGPEGARALTNLSQLTELDLSGNSIGDEGLRELRGLAQLTRLDLSDNSITDISALNSLERLEALGLSGNQIDTYLTEFWFKPSLQYVDLDKAKLGDVPPEEFSQGSSFDNLARLRAHFRDRAGGEEAISDVKFIVLGNGQIGKTQICRRLRNEPFDPTINSTHGVLISAAELTAADPAERLAALKIWDFGGQDIYLGTHALFLRSRAIFLVAWTPDSERRTSHDDGGGFTFRNYPLSYWVNYVSQMAGVENPLLLVETQCDQIGDGARRPPANDKDLEKFQFLKSPIHYSAKTDRGRETLMAALRESVAWLNEKHQSNAKIGINRAEVKRRLERMQQATQAAREAKASGKVLNQAAEKALEESWITHTRFEEICHEEGVQAEPHFLLDYLHHIGTVFFRKGQFLDRIVVDQPWALEAIYAIFDRRLNVYGHLRDRRKGRFTRLELGLLLWDRKYSDREQKLFISMMCGCDICFPIREAEEDVGETEYVAPDLLPKRAALELDLADRWDDKLVEEQATFSYELLPPGLLRSLMAEIGKKAGLRADYWQDGFYFYDTTTKARALVQQVSNENDWGGRIDIRTQNGDANALLRNLCEFVNDQQRRYGVEDAELTSPGLGLLDRLFRSQKMTERQKVFAARERAKEILDNLEASTAKADANRLKSYTSSLIPGYEESGQPEYYVSYAWGGDSTPEERRREATVDRICEEAQRRGITIVRDRNVIRFGDRISRFMDRLAQGDRIIVVLSDKYLKSPFCMYELHEIYRECRANEDEFSKRVRVIVLPDAKIYSVQDRIEYAAHWRTSKQELSKLIRDVGNETAGISSVQQELLMGRFANQTADILGLVADTLNPQAIEEIDQMTFD